MKRKPLSCTAREGGAQPIGWEGEGSPEPQVFLLEGVPPVGADGVFALLESGELAFDAADVAVFLEGRQHPLRRADCGAMGLRGVDAEAKTHSLQLARRH